jgi:SAM-dependent methyltransferase
MNAITHAGTLRRSEIVARPPDHDAIRALYSQTQQDFGAWSGGYNMHFGYWERGMNPFRREAMLERMNDVAIDALGIERDAHVRIVDLGCGAGATTRAAARRHPWATVIGVTLVRESIALAMKIDRAAGLSRRVAYALTDLANSWMAPRTMDGALAVESFCYAAGADKAPAAREAARLLRPGARLVVVDGFLAADEPGGVFGWIYRRWCDCWAVPRLARLDAFVRALEDAGFEQVEVRDLFWRVAPSAAHIPWVAACHTVRELWRGRGRISAWRRRHIEASWLSIVLGLARGRFRYCMVTATRRA